MTQETKIALVTGASRGIGEAIAITLADYGATCILVSRKADALSEVAEKIASRGGTAEVMACHVGDIRQIEGLMARIRERFGKLDILINNAATNPYFGDMIVSEINAGTAQQYRAHRMTSRKDKEGKATHARHTVCGIPISASDLWKVLISIRSPRTAGPALR